MHHEFINECDINIKKLKKVLAHLHDAICPMHLQMCVAKQCVLLYDNAWAQHSLILQLQFAKHSTAVLPYLQFSPILKLCDFYLFP